MQTKLIILFAIFAINSLKAQNYLPLFELENTEWSIGYSGVNDWIFTGFSLSFTITEIDLDTIIYSNHAETAFSLPDVDSISISVSTDNSKAWIFLEDFNKNILVYDMSLEMGDTFKLYTFDESTLDSTAVVVDTVFISEGRKNIAFENFGDFLFYEDFGIYSKLKFIEGVGPFNFFFYGYQSLNMSHYPKSVICKKNNGIIEYSALLDGSCEITNLNSVSLPLIKVYPNPTSNFILLHDVIPQNVLVYDLLGKKTAIGFKNSTLDVSNLSNGVYFLIVEDLNGEIYQSKFIKN